MCPPALPPRRAPNLLLKRMRSRSAERLSKEGKHQLRQSSCAGAPGRLGEGLCCVCQTVQQMISLQAEMTSINMLPADAHARIYIFSQQVPTQTDVIDK